MKKMSSVWSTETKWNRPIAFDHPVVWESKCLKNNQMLKRAGKTM